MNDGLLEILVCPITHSKLRRVKEGDAEYLVSEEGGVRYPIKEGLPVLLPEAAILPAGFKTVAQVKAAFRKARAG